MEYIEASFNLLNEMAYEEGIIVSIRNTNRPGPGKILIQSFFLSAKQFIQFDYFF